MSVIFDLNLGGGVIYFICKLFTLKMEKPRHFSSMQQSRTAFSSVENPNSTQQASPRQMQESISTQQTVIGSARKMLRNNGRENLMSNMPFSKQPSTAFQRKPPTPDILSNQYANSITDSMMPASDCITAVYKQIPTNPSKSFLKTEDSQNTFRSDDSLEKTEKVNYNNKPMENSCIRIENQNQSAVNSSIRGSQNTPLRALTPIIPTQTQSMRRLDHPNGGEIKHSIDKLPQNCEFTSHEVQTAEFKLIKRDQSPSIFVKDADQHKEFMSPDSLMDEFRAKAVEDSESGECSQLYETGGQSAALKSASAEIKSDDTRELRNNDSTREGLTQSQNIQNSTLPTMQNQENTNTSSSMIRTNSHICSSQPNMHQQSTDSVTAAYENIISHLHRPKGLEPCEDATKPDFEFKKKIVLNFDKMDLDRKLDEMTKCVNDFKKQWQGTETTHRSDDTGQSSRMSPLREEAFQVPATSTDKKSHTESIRTVEDYKRSVPYSGVLNDVQVQIAQSKYSREATFRAQVETDRSSHRGEDRYKPQTRSLPRAQTSQTPNGTQLVNLKESFMLQPQPVENDLQIDDYVKDFENRERSEIRRKAVMANFQERKQSLDSQRGKQTRFANPENDRDYRDMSLLNGEAPQPRNLPTLLTHDLPYGDKEQIQSKYVALAMNSDEEGINVKSQRNEQGANLISCLKGPRLDTGRNSQNKGLLSFDHYGQPRHAERFQQLAEDQNQSSVMSDRGEKPHHRKRNSNTQQLGSKQWFSQSSFEKTVPDFVNIRKQQQQNVGQFEHEVRIKQTRSRSRSKRNSNESRSVSREQPDRQRESYVRSQSREKQLEDPGKIITRKISTMSGLEGFHSDTFGAARETNESDPMFSNRDQDGETDTQHAGKNMTYRSVGIESFYLRGEQKAQPWEDTNLRELQEKSEDFCKKMSFARKQRLQNEENMNELTTLRDENIELKRKITQSESAISMQRECALQSHDEITRLKQRVTDLEVEITEIGDPNLFKTYKEMEQMRDDMQAELASKTFTMTQKEKDYETIKEQYESLKKSQLQLVGMNKNILVQRQTESVEIQHLYDQAKKEINEKTNKLQKYQDIVKTFNSQIQMFEDFQKSSLKDINMLRTQVSLFQDLFQKEKLEKEALLKRVRPSERHAAANSVLDNYTNKSAAPHHQTNASNSFDYQQFQGDSNVSSYRNDKTIFANQHTSNLYQTMSKQLSFGQPFHERGSFDRRKSSHIEPPLQIFHESSSEPDDGGYANELSYQDYSYNGGAETPQDEYPPAMQHQPYSQDSQMITPMDTSGTTGCNTPLPEEPTHNIKRAKKRQNLEMFLNNSIQECSTSEQFTEMPTIEKPNLSKFKTEKQLLGCASAVFNQRRLSYKKKRNPSVTSHERHSSKKMVPMSTQDYYTRLKEMQSRLEKARNDISGNVSRSRSRSMSRSTSPLNTATSQAATASAAASHKIPDYLKRVLNTSKSSASKIVQDEHPKKREDSVNNEQTNDQRVSRRESMQRSRGPGQRNHYNSHRETKAQQTSKQGSFSNNLFGMPQR